MLYLGANFGYKNEQLLRLVDREKNTPLHAAVNSGSYEVVYIEAHDKLID